ncbi:DUF2510 domain-containing protein [Mycobacterium sp. B14F4]|uniref:DUF2510 domain-containing protein n=1 Tax=Mycobacterium sp. B14F4 TaxID=3153565 RepID=UPI00325F1298
MNATPPGWYPEPSGEPSLRYYDGSRWTERTSPRPNRGTPKWVWAAVAAGVCVVLAVVVGVLVFNSGPPMPEDRAPASPSASPARSTLIPELQLPEGTTKRDYKSQEVFDVTRPFADTVDALRSQLPIGRVYDGLAWCAESDTGEESTTWSWGDESDYLSVWVSSSPQNPGSTVQIEREPRPAGCAP